MGGVARSSAQEVISQVILEEISKDQYLTLLLLLQSQIKNNATERPAMNPQPLDPNDTPSHYPLVFFPFLSFLNPIFQFPLLPPSFSIHSEGPSCASDSPRNEEIAVQGRSDTNADSSSPQQKQKVRKVEGVRQDLKKQFKKDLACVVAKCSRKYSSRIALRAHLRKHHPRWQEEASDYEP